MIHHGDCIEVMRTMPDASVDAIVTDPPAGISFMNKSWDHHLGGRDAWVAWMTEVMAECYRLLKPGGHILVWALPRTSHWTGWAIESAGFEPRDKIIHAFASGFPKSLDVSKAIDKAEGAERAVVGPHPTNFCPATDAARQWEGWGTALKPAYEDWWLARKPLRGTVAANVLEFGTGALNIEGCRIPTSDADRAAIEAPNGFLRAGYQRTRTDGTFMQGTPEATAADASKGRWPANVILTDPIFDGGVEGVVGGGIAQSGLMRAGTLEGHESYGEFPGREMAADTYGDSGTYSRFFLIPKASRSDREPAVRPEGHESGKRFSNHPTMKPTELMRHLVRLVTPPGGTVLDPFLGSGSTAIAAEQEGLAWVGIEKEAEYVAIAEARLNGTQRGLGLDVAVKRNLPEVGEFTTEATSYQFKSRKAADITYRWPKEKPAIIPPAPGMFDEPDEEPAA